MDTSLEESLISEVQSREILWKKSHSQYKNSYRRGKEWDLIATNLKVAKNSLKNKWQSLIKKFKCEVDLARFCKSGDGLEDSYESVWPHYKSMQFLLDSVTPRKLTGNLADLDFEETFEEFSQPDIKDTFDCENNTVDMKAINTEKSANKHNRITAGMFADMEQKRLALVEKVLNSENVVPKSESETSSDDDMLFFKTLMVHVKKIDPSQKLRFRNDINRIVHSYAYPNENWQTSPLISAAESASTSRKKSRQVDENNDDCVLIDWKMNNSFVPKRIKEEKKYKPSIWEQTMYNRDHVDYRYSGLMQPPQVAQSNARPPMFEEYGARSNLSQQHNQHMQYYNASPYEINKDRVLSQQVPARKYLSTNIYDDPRHLANASREESCNRNLFGQSPPLRSFSRSSELSINRAVTPSSRRTPISRTSSRSGHEFSNENQCSTSSQSTVLKTYSRSQNALSRENHDSSQIFEQPLQVQVIPRAQQSSNALKASAPCTAIKECELTETANVSVLEKQKNRDPTLLLPSSSEGMETTREDLEMS